MKASSTSRVGRRLRSLALGAPAGMPAAFVLTAFLAGDAVYAAMLSYHATVSGEARGVTVAVIVHDGTEYCSLTSAVTQLGGGGRITAARAQVDLVGHTAWIGLNDRQVNGSLDRFQLAHPMVRRENDALIAVSDLIPFFERAFRVTVAPQTGGGSVLQQDLSEPSVSPGTAPSAAPPPGVPGLRMPEVIILDAGHGGANAGVEGPHGLKEKDLVLALARRLKQLIEQSKTAKAVLTRDADLDVPQRDRAGIAGKNKGGLFLSIHAGGSFSGADKGFEIFVPPAPAAAAVPSDGTPPAQDFSAASLQAARAIETSLAEAIGAPSRGIHIMRMRTFRNVGMPALLIEIGCLTNADEESLLQTEGYQMRVAQGIAAGIMKAANAPAPTETAP